MTRFFPLYALILILASCQNRAGHSPSPQAAAPAKKLTLDQLLFLIEDEKSAYARTNSMLASGNTYDMVDGLNSRTDYLKPSYVRLLKMTQGDRVFAGEDPREYVESRLESAYREADRAYHERLEKGLDGSGGKVEAPLARLERLKELISEEVEFYSTPSTYKKWKSLWDSDDRE